MGALAALVMRLVGTLHGSSPALTERRSILDRPWGVKARSPRPRGSSGELGAPARPALPGVGSAPGHRAPRTLARVPRRWHRPGPHSPLASPDGIGSIARTRTKPSNQPIIPGTSEPPSTGGLTPATL